MRHREVIKALGEILEKHGHQFSFDWASQPSLKPYVENQNQCRTAAGAIGEALKHTDVFVLISDEAGTDMFIETGIAIGCKKDGASIYNVGPYNKRSLMQFHPDIKQVDNLEDIFKLHLPEAITEVQELDKKLALEFSGDK